MRFQLALIPLFTLTTAQHTYNVTQAFQPGNFQKYQCLTTEKVNTWLPPCLHECQAKANKADGCAYDDIACHCVNSAVYTPLIEHCAFPAKLGGNGTCTMAELMAARPIIADMCNFYNATLYATYSNCSQELSKNKTLALVASGDTIIQGPKKWNGTAQGKGWYGKQWNGPNSTAMVNMTGLWWKA